MEHLCDGFIAEQLQLANQQTTALDTQYKLLEHLIVAVNC